MDEAKQQKISQDSYMVFKDWDLNSFGKLDKYNKKLFDKELNKTKKNFTSGSKVLEIGFGNGEFLTYANSQHWLVKGVEVNQVLVDLAKSKGYDAMSSDNFKRLPHNTYDLIVAFDVIEHIPEAEILNFLQTILSLLKPGGVFLARCPNGDSPFSLPYQNGDATHVNYLGSSKIKHYVSQTKGKLIYCGSEAFIIIHKNIFTTLLRLFAFVLRALLALFVYVTYLKRVNFVSPNLIIAIKK